MTVTTAISTTSSSSPNPVVSVSTTCILTLLISCRLDAIARSLQTLHDSLSIRRTERLTCDRLPYCGNDFLHRSCPRFCRLRRPSTPLRNLSSLVGLEQHRDSL